AESDTGPPGARRLELGRAPGAPPHPAEVREDRGVEERERVQVDRVARRRDHVIGHHLTLALGRSEPEHDAVAVPPRADDARSELDRDLPLDARAQPPRPRRPERRSDRADARGEREAPEPYR